jgi:hypothetical protein
MEAASRSRSTLSTRPYQSAVHRHRIETLGPVATVLEDLTIALIKGQQLVAEELGMHPL